MGKEDKIVYVLTSHAAEDISNQRKDFNAFLERLEPVTEEEVDRVLAEREVISPEPDLDPSVAAQLRREITKANAKART